MGIVTLITGCSSGFGRVLAEMLAREADHTVYATMRDIAGRNAQAAAELSAIGGIRVLEMDVASDQSVDRAVAQALAEAGQLDCVVNNAGFGNFGLTESYTPDQWMMLFQTNLLGCVRVNRAALPGMRKRRSGLLVHVTSGAGRVAIPYLGPYVSSKWALEGYAECLRLELNPFHVDSVVVEPGKYKTEVFAKMFPGADPAPSAEYGDGDRSANFMKCFIGGLEALNQDPAEVAAKIAELIRMPWESRPFRTLSGIDVQSLTSYNAAADEIRAMVSAANGVPELNQR